MSLAGLRSGWSVKHPLGSFGAGKKRIRRTQKEALWQCGPQSSHCGATLHRPECAGVAGLRPHEGPLCWVNQVHPPFSLKPPPFLLSFLPWWLRKKSQSHEAEPKCTPPPMLGAGVGIVELKSAPAVPSGEKPPSSDQASGFTVES